MKRAGRVTAARHQVLHARPVLHSTHPVPVHLGGEGQLLLNHTTHPVPVHLGGEGRLAEPHHTPSPHVGRLAKSWPLPHLLPIGVQLLADGTVTCSLKECLHYFRGEYVRCAG